MPSTLKIYRINNDVIEPFELTWPQLMLRKCRPDSKIHGANTGPTWVLLAPDGPHVGPMNLAIRVIVSSHANLLWSCHCSHGITDENYRCLHTQFRLIIFHYDDVIMTTIASQITSLTVVYSTVYSDADERKHQSSASLAFVWGIHRDRWIPRTKGQLRGKCFHLMTSSCRGNRWSVYGRSIGWSNPRGPRSSKVTGWNLLHYK